MAHLSPITEQGTHMIDTDNGCTDFGMFEIPPQIKILISRASLSSETTSHAIRPITLFLTRTSIATKHRKRANETNADRYQMLKQEERKKKYTGQSGPVSPARAAREQTRKTKRTRELDKNRHHRRDRRYRRREAFEISLFCVLIVPAARPLMRSFETKTTHPTSSIHL